LEESLLCHQKSEHVHNVNTSQCDHCPRIFFSKAAKVIHENMHSEAQKSEYYMCKYCLDTAALTISEIVEHYKEYHEGYALPYFQCENCDFYSNKFSDTKEHLKQEHEIDDYNPYRCSHCEYVTPELSRFAYHIQRFFKK
jgi:hypothetical protein